MDLCAWAVQWSSKCAERERDIHIFTVYVHTNSHAKPVVD